MDEVYRAQHTRLKGIVAVKIVSARFSVPLAAIFTATDPTRISAVEGRT
jgi:hypothetical protein